MCKTTECQAVCGKCQLLSFGIPTESCGEEPIPYRGLYSSFLNPAAEHEEETKLADGEDIDKPFSKH